MSVYNIKLYECPCGYYTTIPANANKHKKTSCKLSGRMKLVDKIFKDITDKDNAVNDVSTTIGINNGNVSIVDNSVNTNIYIPQNSLKDDMIDFLKTVVFNETPSTSQILQMPSRVLYNARNPEKHPGAITERGDKIVEKLPGGGERIMGRKKAIKMFTCEAVDALCQKPPTQHVRDYYEKERKIGKKEYTIKEAVSANAKNSVEYHHKIPSDLKNIVVSLEDRIESEMDNITKENRVLF